MVTTTCPPSDVTRNFFNRPPHTQVQTTCVNSCPKTYTHIGFGKRRYTTSQHAIPASIGTHVVSALPLAQITRHNAVPAPMQAGSSTMPAMNLTHFGTATRIQNPPP